MIVRCNNCGHYFFEEELNEKNCCLESEYGVYGEFNSHTYTTIYACPNCGSTELEEIGIDEEDLVDYLNKLNEKGKIK